MYTVGRFVPPQVHVGPSEGPEGAAQLPDGVAPPTTPEGEEWDLSSSSEESSSEESSEDSTAKAVRIASEASIIKEAEAPKQGWKEKMKEIKQLAFKKKRPEPESEGGVVPESEISAKALKKQQKALSKKKKREEAEWEYYDPGPPIWKTVFNFFSFLIFGTLRFISLGLQWLLGDTKWDLEARKLRRERVDAQLNTLFELGDNLKLLLNPIHPKGTLEQIHDSEGKKKQWDGSAVKQAGDPKDVVLKQFGGAAKRATQIMGIGLLGREQVGFC